MLKITKFMLSMMVLLESLLTIETTPLLKICDDVEESSSTPKPIEGEKIDHYDQRQNGSQNYHINVDGLIFIVAPADALLMAGAGLMDDDNFESSLSDIFGNDQGILGEISKPDSIPSTTTKKPEIDKEQQLDQSNSTTLMPNPAKKLHLKTKSRSSLRLANLIVPLLRRLQNDHSKRGTNGQQRQEI